MHDKFTVTGKDNFMYANNIKIFAKNEKELEILKQTVKIYNQERYLNGMWYWKMHKHCTLLMKKVKNEKNWLELSSKEKITTLEKRRRKLQMPKNIIIPSSKRKNKE